MRSTTAPPGSAVPAAADRFHVRRAGSDSRSAPTMLQPEDLPHLIRAGDTIVTGHGSGWPRRCVEALVAAVTVPARIVHNRVDEPVPYFDDPAVAVRHIGLMVARGTRTPIAQHRADYVPNCYGVTPALVARGPLACDVAILHVSPPDRDGWCSLGTCVAYLPAAAAASRVVIAQVNRQMPRTRGTSIHLRDIDYAVEVDDPLPEAPPPQPDPVTDAIATQVASLVEDGDTVQVGIGRLGDAVLSRLTTHGDLRMWTETFSDAAITLLQAGILRPGAGDETAITATFVTGSRRLYDAVRDNPSIAMLPVDRTNAPASLATVPRLVAINSAIEVDLTGQINAESIGDRLYSGTGGHLDFAVGASYSAGGRYVCTIPSRAKGRSRIVGRLSPGAGVTVPRSLAGIIVTEYGIADLRGCTLGERREKLIAIAHPDHRDELRAAGSGRGDDREPPS